MPCCTFLYALYHQLFSSHAMRASYISICIYMYFHVCVSSFPVLIPHARACIVQRIHSSCPFTIPNISSSYLLIYLLSSSFHVLFCICIFLFFSHIFYFFVPSMPFCWCLYLLLLHFLLILYTFIYSSIFLLPLLPIFSFCTIYTHYLLSFIYHHFSFSCSLLLFIFFLYLLFPFSILLSLLLHILFLFSIISSYYIYAIFLNKS